MDDSFLGTYHVGDSKTVGCDFTDDDGEPADPTDVTLIIHKPDGTVVTLTDVSTPAITNPAEGRYEVEVGFDMHGRWDFRYVGTGEIDEVDETWVRVKRSKVLTP